MKKSTDMKPQRNLPVTIVTGFMAVVIAFVTYLMLPITSFIEGVTFGMGVLLFIIASITAFEGKPGTIRELIYSLTFWSR